MKKLLVAAGDKELSAVTMDFACYLAKLTKSKLSGVFPDTIPHEKTLITGLTEDAPHMQALQHSGADPQVVAGNQIARQIKRFREACAVRNVNQVVHHASSVDEVIALTRFADALIIDPDFTLHEHVLEAYPSHWAKKLLHEAACPVIIAPLSFDGIDEIILTYDGSQSSLYAIRQALYLFPELQDTKATILQVWPEEDERPKEQPALQDWLKNHFSNIKPVVLEGPSNARLIEYLLSHPRAFIVMGGFGRSRISRILQPSASGTVVRLVASPVFMAHQ